MDRRACPFLPVLILSALLLTGVLPGCAGEPPPPPPDPALVSLYCELALAAGDAGPAAADSTRQAIFRRHGTTLEAFEAALQPYREDPRGWLAFFRAVSDTLDAIVLQRYAR